MLLLLDVQVYKLVVNTPPLPSSLTRGLGIDSRVYMGIRSDSWVSDQSLKALCVQYWNRAEVIHNLQTLPAWAQERLAVLMVMDQPSEASWNEQHFAETGEYISNWGTDEKRYLLRKQDE